MIMFASLLLCSSLFVVARSEKDCLRPEIDVHRDCPRVGYDCSLDNVLSSFVKGELDRGYSTTDSIKCVPGAQLFVKGMEVKDLACVNRKWKFANQRKATSSALCARPCQDVCAKQLPLSAKPNADEVALDEVSYCFPCTRGFCANPDHRLHGYVNERAAAGIEVDGNLVTCTGSRMWSDKNGHLFEYVACQPRGCKMPDIDIQKDCPRMGYDCSVTDIMEAFGPGQLDTMSRSSGETLKCASNAKLFIDQSEEDRLYCEKGKWRYGEKGKVTKSALCARSCEDTCPYIVPNAAPVDAANASGMAVSPCHKCTQGHCATPKTFLFGYLNAIAEPTAIPEGKASCTGSTKWSDTHGRVFEYLACHYNDVCETLPKALGRSNCAILGYDCSDPNTNNFTSTANGSLLQCTDPSAVLFYGGMSANVRCLRDQWRASVEGDQVMSAVCGMDCTQCSNALPETFPESGDLVNIAYSEMIDVIPPTISGCATASCAKASAKLVGFPADETSPARLTSSLSCNGNGTWKGDNGTEFKYAGCYSDSVCSTFPNNDPIINCPPVGYDCTHLNDNGFQQAGSGSDTTIACSETNATLFIDGAAAHAVCVGDNWRLELTSKDVIQSATCGKPCYICNTHLPSTLPNADLYTNIANTEAVILVGPTTSGCTTATCQSPSAILIGFHDDSTAQPDELQSATCSGEGSWIADNGATYSYVGCYTDSNCLAPPQPSPRNCAPGHLCSNSNSVTTATTGHVTILTCADPSNTLFVDGAPASVVCAGDSWHTDANNTSQVMTVACGTTDFTSCTSCAPLEQYLEGGRVHPFSEFSVAPDENGCSVYTAICSGPVAIILVTNTAGHSVQSVSGSEQGTPDQAVARFLCDADGYYYFAATPENEHPEHEIRVASLQCSYVDPNPEF